MPPPTYLFVLCFSISGRTEPFTSRAPTSSTSLSVISSGSSQRATNSLQAVLHTVSFLIQFTILVRLPDVVKMIDDPARQDGTRRRARLLHLAFDRMRVTFLGRRQ